MDFFPIDFRHKVPKRNGHFCSEIFAFLCNPEDGLGRGGIRLDLVISLKMEVKLQPLFMESALKHMG